MFNLKASTRRIVSLFRSNEEIKPEVVKSKQSFYDVRQLELQELEDFGKVMNEVKKVLKIPSHRVKARKIEHSGEQDYQHSNYILSRFKVKERYQQRRAQEQEDKKLRKQAEKEGMEQDPQNDKEISLLKHRQTKLDQSIGNYKKFKQEFTKPKTSYREVINGSQKEALKFKVNQNTNLSYRIQDDSFSREHIISMVDSRMKEPYEALPKYGSAEFRQQGSRQKRQSLVKIIENIHKHYMGETPQTQQQYKQKVKQNNFLLEENSDRLLRECKNFFETKSKMNTNFDAMIDVLTHDKPLTQSIRQKSYTFTEQNDKINVMRKTADNMRKVFFLRNDHQRQWYKKIIKGCRDFDDPMTKCIFDELKKLLEERQNYQT